MNRTITHFAIYHHASYSLHLSSPHRPNINQEDPCLLGLCLDDTNPWLENSHLLFPLFYSRAVHFSHLRGFWDSKSSAKNLPPWWSGGNWRMTTTMGTQDIWSMLCTDTTPTQDPGRAWGVDLYALRERMSACFAYFGETFLYSILLNRRLVWHCIPILFQPILIYRL